MKIEVFFRMFSKEDEKNRIILFNRKYYNLIETFVNRSFWPQLLRHVLRPNLLQCSHVTAFLAIVRFSFRCYLIEKLFVNQLFDFLSIICFDFTNPFPRLKSAFLFSSSPMNNGSLLGFYSRKNLNVWIQLSVFNKLNDYTFFLNKFSLVYCLLKQ